MRRGPPRRPPRRAQPPRYSADSSVRRPEDFRITVRGGHVAGKSHVSAASIAFGGRPCTGQRVDADPPAPSRRRPGDEPCLSDDIVHRHRARLSGRPCTTVLVGRRQAYCRSVRGSRRNGCGCRPSPTACPRAPSPDRTRCRGRDTPSGSAIMVVGIEVRLVQRLAVHRQAGGRTALARSARRPR